jgi:acetyltransferase-like isoleucine patch superfamily enzyme
MKNFIIKSIIIIQLLLRNIFLPLAFIYSFFLNWIFLLFRTIIFIPFYNSILSVKFKKFGKNIVFKNFDANIIGFQHIEFGNNILVGKSFRLEAIQLEKSNISPKIIIGNDVQINDFCHFGACKLIQIKSGCLIASRVFITDHFHGKSDSNSLQLAPLQREIFVKGPVIINENCWIGEGVSIMPDVIIGKNCIIGTNSVVTKSFPDNVIIAGNPARIIRTIN